MKVCVLIPTYKEYDNLKKLIPLLHEKIYKKLPGVKFTTLVVDDNSPDGTKKILTDLSKKYSNLKTSYGEKRGIGAAMKRGCIFAIEKLKPDFIATLEADFVVNPREIIKMVSLLDCSIVKGQMSCKYDVVLASRNNEREYYGGLTLRRLMHILVNTIICKVIGGMTQVHEHTAACRVIKVKGVLDAIDLNSLPNGYAFFGVILFPLSKVTDKFYEHKVPFFERTVGQSKMSIKKVKPMVKEMKDYLSAAVKNRISPRIHE
jgi:dolichol-phosphate mannosyltransferase